MTVENLKGRAYRVNPGVWMWEFFMVNTRFASSATFTTKELAMADLKAAVNKVCLEIKKIHPGVKIIDYKSQEVRG